jgi:hypothetical protein
MLPSATQESRQRRKPRSRVIAQCGESREKYIANITGRIEAALGGVCQSRTLSRNHGVKFDPGQIHLASSGDKDIECSGDVQLHFEDSA